MVLSNWFGLNAPAIAQLECEYEEMWAQDVSRDGGLSRWGVGRGRTVDAWRATLQQLLQNLPNLGNGNIGNANIGIGNNGLANIGNGNLGNYDLGNGNLGNANLGNGNIGNETRFRQPWQRNIGNGNTGNNNIGIGNTNTGWNHGLQPRLRQ